MNKILTYARKHQQTHLEELKEFLRIPSVSTQPDHTEDVASAAAWIANKMETAGLENVRVIATRGHPLIYADWLHAGENKPTVLIYGHYDVQPVDPLDLWETPPFEPTIRGDYVYGRGSSDDKGQMFIHIKAVEAYLAVNGRLPVNVKFIIEGEEESGGESLTAFIPENKELLAADVALVSDTGILSPDQPSIIYALRGMTYAFIDVTGPDHDLHSGSAGGAVDNPINALAHIIAGLKDVNGRIQIPGFYDKVRELETNEREMLAQLPTSDVKWLRETGVPQLMGEPGYSTIERIGARPTLDVNGIIGGYTGAGAKTVLPSVAHAKVSMRLVPDQDPQEIYDLFAKYVQKIAPPSVTVKTTLFHFAPASISDYSIPAIKAAGAAYEQVFGKQPVFMREGGSIPVVSEFQHELGLETVLMGFGLPDDRIHSPNERFYLPNFYRGIETAILFLAEYGAG